MPDLSLDLSQWSAQMDADRLDERMTILDRCNAIETGKQVDGQLFVPFAAVIHAVDPSHFPAE